ncbi:MAG: lasso RiPP family leader peptide-containing protein [Nitrospirota bacterium]
MQRETRPVGRKKPYAPPTLLEYGSVAKLTEKKSGSIPDGKSGMTMGHGKGGKGGMHPGMGMMLGFGLDDD